MEIAGYIAALFIGLSLGLIGGGGSILTVPVFVYLFRIPPIAATSYSLFVVGSTKPGRFIRKLSSRVDRSQNCFIVWDFINVNGCAHQAVYYPSDTIENCCR